MGYFKELSRSFKKTKLMGAAYVDFWKREPLCEFILKDEKFQNVVFNNLDIDIDSDKLEEIIETLDHWGIGTCKGDLLHIASICFIEPLIMSIALVFPDHELTENEKKQGLELIRAWFYTH